jgi:hypothetical protein
MPVGIVFKLRLALRSDGYYVHASRVGLGAAAVNVAALLDSFRGRVIHLSMAKLQIRMDR